jgi:hypothetical protein
MVVNDAIRIASITRDLQEATGILRHAWRELERTVPPPLAASKTTVDSMIGDAPDLLAFHASIGVAFARATMEGRPLDCESIDRAAEQASLLLSRIEKVEKKNADDADELLAVRLVALGMLVLEQRYCKAAEPRVIPRVGKSRSGGTGSADLACFEEALLAYHEGRADRRVFSAAYSSCIRPSAYGLGLIGGFTFLEALVFSTIRSSGDMRLGALRLLMPQE